MDYPLDNPFDSSQRSWISWCPGAFGFWEALWKFRDYDCDYCCRCLLFVLLLSLQLLITSILLSPLLFYCTTKPEKGNIAIEFILNRQLYKPGEHCCDMNEKTSTSSEINILWRMSFASNLSRGSFTGRPFQVLQFNYLHARVSLWLAILMCFVVCSRNERVAFE